MADSLFFKFNFFKLMSLIVLLYIHLITIHRFVMCYFIFNMEN